MPPPPRATPEWEFLKRRFGPRALMNQVFTRCTIFFFFRSTLLMLNEMDCPSYWNNKLSVRIWQLKTHGRDGRRSFGWDYWHIGVTPPSAWLGPERPQISHESLGIPNQTERAVYTVSHSVVSDSLQPHGLYVARQAPLSVGFSW